MSVEEEFRSRWQACRHPPDTMPDVEPLLARYREAHRHYHNAAHILDCLDQLALYQTAAPDAAPSPDIAVSLFYHDVIYDPRAVDNEEQSAQFAWRHLAPHLPPEQIEAITRLVRATDHRHPPVQADEQLIVDVDLSILGRDAATFDAYDRAIRAEYAHVPADAYRAGRSQVLQHFLSRPHLYYTPWFLEQYEATARVNLQQALQRLRA